MLFPQNFATMQLSEIEDNIVARRNRIFLLMEEVRRLRIQRRLKVKAAVQVPPPFRGLWETPGSQTLDFWL